MNSSGGHSSFVHIRSIEVKFGVDRTKYPVSIKVSFGGNTTDKSRDYNRNEHVHWLLERRIESESQFTIDVRERHSLRRTTTVMTVLVSPSDLLTKPFFETKESSTNPVSLKIHACTVGPFIDVLRRLIEQSQNRLEAMRAFLEKFGRACEVLDYVVMITEAISSVHSAAESAATLATTLLEFCQKLQDCHSLASELMEDIATFLPFADIPAGGLKCQVTTEITEEMLRLFEATCRAIIKYTNGSILGGLLDDRTDEIRSYREKFVRVKETFGWCLTTETWKTTLKIEETTNALLLQELNPLAKAAYHENKFCFEGSRKDTLREIEEWSESESSSKLFWLYGSTGLGKTAIAHTVANLFHQQNRLVGSFFPSDPQSSDRIMPTIAYHFASWHADYQEYILDVLRGPQKTDVFSGLGGQFDVLIRRPVSAIGFHSPPMHKPLIIVLDALDNCYDTKDCRRSFLEYVVDIAMLVPWMKVFVSSRSSEGIDWLFRQIAVQQITIDDPMLDLVQDVVTCTRLCSEIRVRGSSKPWTEGMINAVRGLFKRISLSFVALTEIDQAILDPVIESLDVQEFFRSIFQIMMEEEAFEEEDIPAVRGILAIMSCVASFTSPSEGALLALLQAVQLHITQDQLRAYIVRLFPIMRRNNENALQFLFPPDVFSKLLSHQQWSGRFYTDTESLKYRLVRHYSAHSLSICPKLMFERTAKQAENSVHISSKNDTVYTARSPNGSRVVSGSLDGTLVICDGWTGERIGEPIKGHVGWVHNIAFTPDGTKFVSASDDGTMRLWDLQAGKLVNELESDSIVYATAFSLDGRRLVSGHLDGRVRIWDARKGTLIALFDYGHRNAVYAVAYSPDGKRIVSGTKDSTLWIWDAETGVPVMKTSNGHKGSIYSVAFSTDRSRIVSGSFDCTARIWDARTGMPLGKPLEGHELWVIDVGYSHDGKTIVSASEDGTVRFWNAIGGALTGILRRGESCWDTERHCFVSVPHWWPDPRWKSFTTQAYIYSANPLYIPDDGWIRTLDEQPFLWVSSEHRNCSCHAASENTMTTNPDDGRLATSAWRDYSQVRDWTKSVDLDDRVSSGDNESE